MEQRRHQGLFTDRFPHKSDRAAQQKSITFGSLYPERSPPRASSRWSEWMMASFLLKTAGGIDLMHQHPMPGDPHRHRESLSCQILPALKHLLIFTGRAREPTRTPQPRYRSQRMCVQSRVSLKRTTV